MSQEEIRETVEKLVVSDGDILHVKLGGEIGDGMPPWIPSDEDCEVHRQDWQDAIKYLGLNVRVVVTHHLTELKVIRPATWVPAHTPQEAADAGD